MAKKTVKKKAAKPVKKVAAKPVAKTLAKPVKKAVVKAKGPLPKAPPPKAAAAKKVAAKPVLAKKAAAPKAVVKKAAPPKPVLAKKSAPMKPIEAKKTSDAKPQASNVANKLAKSPVTAKVTTATKASSPTKPIPEVLAKKSKVKADKEEPAIEELEAAGDDEEEEEGPEEVVLTDAEGRRYCRVKDCDQLSSVDGYCRYHYLLYWKKIQVRKKILSEGKLERYVEDLTSKYPDKFLEVLRKDLRSEKEFLAAIQELEIDESATESEFEDEAQTFIDEVRGMAEPGSGRDEEDF